MPPAPPAPAFVDGRAGALFTLTRQPARSTGAPVLILPPFAEEMNRTRRFLTRLAAALAEGGHATTLLDPFGAGDSAGDFADAGWDLWLDDAGRVAAHLTASAGRPPWILGLRTGALLAAALGADRGPDAVAGLICVHPVTDGGKFLQQFLRARTMAAMARGARESTRDMLAALQAGETLNVAGYALSPALALPLAGMRLADLAAPRAPVLWYETGRDAGEPPARRLSPPESWSTVVRADRHVAAEPFWMIEEPVIPDRLIAAIRDDLSAADAP